MAQIISARAFEHLSLKPPSPRFAGQILHLEMIIETEGSIEALKELLQIYAVIYIQQAIEYFEAIGDNRYKYYKSRMTTMLKDQEKLFGVSSSKFLRSKKQRGLNSQRKAEFLLKKHEVESISVAKKLQLNLEMQSVALKEKMNTRKTKRMRSYSPDLFKKRSESDISGGLPRTDSFEAELEKVIEKSLKQKLRSISEIKGKYTNEKEELKNFGEYRIIYIEMLYKVFAHMDCRMKQEIKNIEKSSEEQKKQEIKYLKSKLIA